MTRTCQRHAKKESAGDHGFSTAKSAGHHREASGRRQSVCSEVRRRQDRAVNPSGLSAPTRTRHSAPPSSNGIEEFGGERTRSRGRCVFAQPLRFGCSHDRRMHSRNREYETERLRDRLLKVSQEKIVFELLQAFPVNAT